MTEQRFQFTSELARPASEVFRWHENPGALERLTPPWTKLEVIQEGEIKDGSVTRLRQKIGPLWKLWEVEHRGCVDGKEFRDVGLKGPFRSWEHLHRVTQTGSLSSNLSDQISYQLPGGVLGNLLAGGQVRKELDRVFRFRHQRLSEDLGASAMYGAVRPMRILVSGASGVIGRALIPFLRTQGHEIVRLTRSTAKNADEVQWDPLAGKLDEHALKTIDAVVHLAGANVAKRWTSAARDEIWRSRVNGTRTLVEAVARMRHRPFVFVSASATGYYGSRGNEILEETAAKGEGFLADLCEAWEHEVAAIGELGIRFAMLRTGMVLTPSGGALAKFLPLFRAGLGAKLGAGDQLMSWISIDDLVGAYYHAILDQRCHGPINAVSPEVTTNREFTHVVAKVLQRPAWLRAPRTVLRLAFGEMADEVLFSSIQVSPQKLQATGYQFRTPNLESTLRFLLGKPAT